ncbi:MAG: T9SS type A sorting domain-containing protein [Flavobacterium sp.]|uniref:T9SS type A sorting domain-containing protein n=1 Tax=Flavobacterium sp. TaxID=239 RepID=UPI00326751C7
MKKKYFLLVALFLFVSGNAQIINFPDANFKAKLLAASPSNSIASNLSGYYFKIDANNDGEIDSYEALNVSSLKVFNSNIIDLTGIEQFVNLKYLYCYNNPIVNLNLTGLTQLQLLDCHNCQLANFVFSGFSNLSWFDIYNNNLTSLDLTNFNLLTRLNTTNNPLGTLNLSASNNINELYCYNNQLTSLNISNLIYLEKIDCGGNNISNLDLSSIIDPNYVTYIDVAGNPILNIDFSPYPYLTHIGLGNNSMTSIDLSSVTSTQLNFLNLTGNNIVSLDFSNYNFNVLEFYFENMNNLEALNLKNNFNNYINTITNCPNLNYICIDESEFDDFNTRMTELNLQNQIQINSYCSFVPGGTFYMIQGQNKFDANNNGCDALDLPLYNLKFNITNGVNSGSLIADNTGDYSIPVQAGTHTITPVFENSTYFTVSPSTASVTFPDQVSPFTQNFCVTANSVHPDLEVSILPIVRARPGFDAVYKIIYKNKGNTTQSGNVTVNFNDGILDFISAAPAVTTQTGYNLSWAFTNLLPFETREITFTLNVNSPIETPAVNNGDILYYWTEISSVANDDMPIDNLFFLNQTVVNSLDPNDKTCLEGNNLGIEKVGQYIHYLIRFENNGTANAQNIVVKDMIDTAKFDVNSIIPIKGSHSFVTNITAENKVEFIFQNINLPFDDVNNDGYVAFKIKTLPTLISGDTFSNTASIYFDYNFPIITNTSTTLITALSVSDFVFSNYFNLYPNPVKEVLNISIKESIEVTSINIYNTLGQLVLVIPNAQNTKTVDVSSLTSGNYFIKINSDKGTSNTKFIKN